MRSLYLPLVVSLNILGQDLIGGGLGIARQESHQLAYRPTMQKLQNLDRIEFDHLPCLMIVCPRWEYFGVRQHEVA